MLDQPTLITDDYRRTALARAVPYAYFEAGGWYLPPDPDPDSARIALRLFPKLHALYPELTIRARQSTADYTPIDFATERWTPRPASEDPWQRVLVAAQRAGITPHEFQRIDADYAIDCLNNGRGAYLGWELGLGKSLGACMIMDGWQANFILIACPNQAKHDPWEQELARFCPWLGVATVGNTPASRRRALDEAHARMEAGEPTALICHYQALPLIEASGPKTVSGWKRFGRWDLLVSDEAHLYKNRSALFTAAARRLSTVGRLNLSGSVMSGKPEALFVPWNMFQPKVYRAQWRDWNDRFLEVIEGDFGREIVGPKLHRLPQFRAALGECLTVRLAKDHLDIPEPHRVERRLAMHDEQARVYRQVADDFFAELADGDDIGVVDGAPLRAGLRRVTGGIPDGDGGLLSIKHDAAMLDIEAAGDSQIVMFGWHKRVVRELERRCLAAGIPCGRIDGDVSHAERLRIIDLFKRGGYRVLVATIKTLSTAANLQNAGVVGMLEDSDDPVDNEQAPGRVIRQGQRNNVTLLNYRIADSVDDLSVLSNSVTKSELRRLVLGA